MKRGECDQARAGEPTGFERLVQTGWSKLIEVEDKDIWTGVDDRPRPSKTWSRPAINIAPSLFNDRPRLAQMGVTDVPTSRGLPDQTRASRRPDAHSGQGPAPADRA